MPDQLAAVIDVASALGAADVARDASALAHRVSEGLFYVACIGQFKRGKSSLINALIDDDLLPTGVVPVTAVITIIRSGPALRPSVRFFDRKEQIVDRHALADFIAEERNPRNRKNVEVIEIEIPNPLLASGMCLVDTPGLGSVFVSNTETARRFLPHVDAALIVIGADPPISADEAAVVEEIAGRVPDLLFVLNKADRMSEPEVAQAAAFSDRVLRERLRRDPEMYVVSALERLQGHTTRDWIRLETRLQTMAHDSGADLVRGAELRGAHRLSVRLLHEIEERRAALLRPVAETEARLEQLRTTIEDATQSLSDLSFLFMAEERRLNDRFSDERELFLRNVTGAAEEELRETIRTSDLNRSALRHFAMRAAQRIAEKRVRAWLAGVEPRAEEMYEKAVERFVQLSRNFLKRASRDTEAPMEFDSTFRTRRRFFFTDLSALTGRLPGASVPDALRSRAAFREKTLRDAGSFLRRLLETNAARVANDLGDRVVESRRRLESEIRAHLENLVAAAGRAAERGREAQLAGEERVRSEVAILDRIESRLAAI